MKTRGACQVKQHRGEPACGRPEDGLGLMSCAECRAERIAWLEGKPAREAERLGREAEANRGRLEYWRK